MKRLKWFLPVILLASIGATQCSSSDVQELTRAGLIIAGEDEQKANTIAQSAGQAAGAFAPLPFDKEREIGGGIAVDSFATQGSWYPNKQVQRYVNLVGRTVVEQSARRGFEFNFAVVESDDINAWSAPGDYVFITTGALKQMKTEAELAGVLGHEITHVTDAHMLTMLKRQQLLEAAATGTQATTKTNLADYSKAVNAGKDILFTKGLDRNMEYQADDGGTELAALAGYDPAGLMDYLKRLRAEAGKSGGGWLESTHPPLDSRISRLEQKMTIDLTGIEGVTNEDRFQKIVGAALTK